MHSSGTGFNTLSTAEQRRSKDAECRRTKSSALAGAFCSTLVMCRQYPRIPGQSWRGIARILPSKWLIEFEFEECIVAVHASTSPSHHSLAPCVVLSAASHRASKCVRGWRYMAVSSLHTQVRLTCRVCNNTSKRQGVSCWSARQAVVMSAESARRLWSHVNRSFDHGGSCCPSSPR